jgi:hypothetical protein
LAAAAGAGSISAAIASSLSFCKQQTKLADLRLDQVLVSGGGARLRGLRGFLRDALRCPVELFDPFANLDLAGLPPADQEQLQVMRYEAVVALGLAVGRLDDTLYSLEILPEAVRKAQRFQQRTIWNIVAAVLVVAVLGLKASRQSAQVTAAQATSAAMKTQITRANNTHNEAAAAIDANKAQRAVLNHLAALTEPMHALIRVHRSIAANLPKQMWIERIDLPPAAGGGGGGKKRAIVVEAAGKDLNGIDVSRVVVDFKQKASAELATAGLDPVMEPLPAAAEASQRLKLTIDLAGGR